MGATPQPSTPVTSEVPKRVDVDHWRSLPQRLQGDPTYRTLALPPSLGDFRIEGRSGDDRGGAKDRGLGAQVVFVFRRTRERSLSSQRQTSRPSRNRRVRGSEDRSLESLRRRRPAERRRTDVWTGRRRKRKEGGTDGTPKFHLIFIVTGCTFGDEEGPS